MATQTIPQLSAQPRDGRGTRDAARLRDTGRIPGVIYGHKQDVAHISIDRSAIEDLLHHNAHLITVDVEGKAESCLIKEVQWDHLGSHIIHTDLTRVDLNETVEVEVEIELVGEAVGTKEGGAYLEQVLMTLEVACRAMDIPEAIKLDVTEMNVGDVLTVADLKLPPGIKALAEADTAVAAIHVSKGLEEEEEAAEAAEGAEPEVIGAKKEEGQGDED